MGGGLVGNAFACLPWGPGGRHLRLVLSNALRLPKAELHHCRRPGRRVPDLCELLGLGRRSQTQQATQNTNSVAVRNKTESATIALWRTSPVVGVGIYYYTDPAYQEMSRWLVAPTNAVVEALAEGGIVLAAGFIIFNVGAHVRPAALPKSPRGGRFGAASRIDWRMAWWTSFGLRATRPSMADCGHGDGSGRGHGSHGDRRIRGARLRAVRSTPCNCVRVAVVFPRANRRAGVERVAWDLVRFPW